MTDSEITFTDLPPDPRGSNGVDWYAIAEELRSNPGKWALVNRDSHSTAATEISSGRKKAFRPAGHFAAATRKNGEKRDLYVRYVGESA